MIHDIVNQLGAYLLAQGVPLPVIDGPEIPTTTWGRERIVLEHTDQPDKYGPTISQHINPKHRRTRTPTYKLTLYAQSKMPGAAVFEHNRRAEKLLEMVLVAMDNVAASMLRRANGWTPVSSRLVTPPNFAKTETPGGAVYELLFTFDRPVIVRNFVGEIQPEHTLGSGGVRSRTSVSLTHGSEDEDEPADETACGA